MMHDPYLPCLKAPIDSSRFHNRLVLYKKHICTHTLVRPYPSDSYKGIFFSLNNNSRMSATGYYASSSSLFLSTSPSLSLSLVSNSLWLPRIHFWSNKLLVFCFTIVVSFYSNSYELVTPTSLTLFRTLIDKLCSTLAAMQRKMRKNHRLQSQLRKNTEISAFDEN
ncbi:unnamed protein product [Hymenolepis diminuta]|uniref:Uncharacterized protein n=1 Tax=Hymenolepis diminuta TaxID=6216 RepID=A0A564YST1_HYMDI|nr:unnamed protein product [Hymenolepis diminuta]